ncbi:MAG: DUF433 domain-containing protein [Chloroflexi bacterium]|nr:DUF433 domain-containing protein [Chloroflexota bacterium]
MQTGTSENDGSLGIVTLTQEPQAGLVPIQFDPDGVSRVGGTRVRLDTVITAFENGSTPEEIVYKYPSLQLADVYAVIAYYLRRREDVDSYLVERRRVTEEAAQEIEQRFPSNGIRDRLLSRRPECSVEGEWEGQVRHLPL